MGSKALGTAMPLASTLVVSIGRLRDQASDPASFNIKAIVYAPQVPWKSRACYVLYRIYQQHDDSGC